MKEHHYQCKTCRCTFDFSIKTTDGNGREHECCPNCGSWNYHLTNLSVISTDDNDVYLVDYSSPGMGMTLYSTPDKAEAYRVYNRMLNLKWDVFQSIISGNSAHEVKLYLNNQPCMMNGFEPE
jgi:hypothetical protein